MLKLRLEELLHWDQTNGELLHWDQTNGFLILIFTNVSSQILLRNFSNFTLQLLKTLLCSGAF